MLPAVEPVYEFPEDDAVQFIPHDFVFNAMLDRWVVVDLDDNRLVSDNLDVHAVQTLTDERGGLDRQFSNLGGDAVEGDGFIATGAGNAVGPVLDYLPVTAGHVVFAAIDTFATENTDAPVKIGRAETPGPGGWRN